MNRWTDRKKETDRHTKDRLTYEQMGRKTGRHINRWTDRKKVRHSNRRTERKKVRHTNKWTDRKADPRTSGQAER
jgi:hypothetical protein